MRRKIQQGFSLVSAIFLLVVIAALGTFAVTLSTTQHQSAAMDVMGSRAYQAARAGIEWAAFGVTQTEQGTAILPASLWAGCATGATFTPGGATALSGTLAPFLVVVTCTSNPYTEGTNPPPTIYIYDITSRATVGAVGSADYVERVIRVKMGK